MQSKSYLSTFFIYSHSDEHFYFFQDGTDQPATQRAYHPEELKSNETLKPDIKYYLSQQIHPVVSRLCDPIEGVDSAQIAEHLGRHNLN